MGTDGKNDGGFRRDGARDDDGDGARRDGAGSTRLRGNGVRSPGGDA
ncbi:membrane protein insertase YidC, partial [Streptomyces sp. SID9913]|nr:membrane protein insertase YidC [Streptomyces sp. SID9913]